MRPCCPQLLTQLLHVVTVLGPPCHSPPSLTKHLTPVWPRQALPTPRRVTGAPLPRAAWPWLADSACLRRHSEDCWACCCASFPPEAAKAAPCLSAAWAQRAELHALSQACAVAKGKPTICTPIVHVSLGPPRTLGYLGKQCGSLLLMR